MISILLCSELAVEEGRYRIRLPFFTSVDLLFFAHLLRLIFHVMLLISTPKARHTFWNKTETKDWNCFRLAAASL